MTATPRPDPTTPAPDEAHVVERAPQTQPVQPSPALAAPVSVPTRPATIVKRSKAAPVLAVLLILTLLGGGAAGTLYYVNKKASDKTISDQKKQIDDATAAAKKSADDLTKTRADLTKTLGELDAAKKQANQNSECVQAGKDLTAATLRQDTVATDRALSVIYTACGNIPTPSG